MGIGSDPFVIDLKNYWGDQFSIVDAKQLYGLHQSTTWVQIKIITFIIVSELHVNRPSL